MPIGTEGSGVVVAVGSGVESLMVGDEVYGLLIEKPMFRKPPPAFASEYAVADEKLLLRKPSHLSFEGAASMAGFVTTAHQVIRRGLQLSGEDSLEGKTVYVPAALSGTGSVVIQVAKNVYGASKIISTVSTPKMNLVEDYLPGLVDHLVDYKTQDVVRVVGRQSVDWVINTQPDALNPGIKLLKRDTGICINMAGLPGKHTVKEMIGAENLTWWTSLLLDLAALLISFKFWGSNIKYEFVSGGTEIREDLELAGETVARQRVQPVIRTVRLDDLQAVRNGCFEVYAGKGGIGKLIIRIAN
jgi:NADPH:quinone reductase-like Zn-dependent oxidoreductase